MAVVEKGLLTRPRSWRDTPQRPKSDKFCSFHNDYGHTTEECKHLKNEIERLIQNGYLQEYVCWEKVRGTGPYQKREGDKAKEIRASNPERSPKEIARQASGGKGEDNDVPRNGIIRMITRERTTTFPAGGDSHRERKSQIREAHDISLKEVIEVEAMEDTPLIQFERAERSGPRTSHNDALVITAVLADYELSDVSMEKVNTLLYGFAGEVVHPRGMISLPLTMGAGTARKTGMLKFLVVDVPSAYNLFVKDRRETWTKITKGSSSNKGKETVAEGALKEMEAPAKVQPTKELLNIEVIPGSPDKTTRIGSHLCGETKEEIVSCLRCNANIFAWAPQDLEGVDPKVITHHLNIRPGVKSVKQKKRHFGPKRQIPKLWGKWRMCIDFRDLNKACPKDFYPLPRIDQLVDSTSGCKLLSMMDASQGYHQIMLAPEDRKRVSFITSNGTFCYVAMPFGLKNAGATYQDLWTRYSDHR
ncbi:UNVERIFIED_CONTAM: Transposon Ty3-G Gag-Pol polyprotein [Sesamum radiatum]|uniref:Transposon Ty3-G Gag-Pol polyprotein n=1 Tax=Sesamum radiatum TaxID=300843 RepID=A0AAW2R153_SESRA